MEYIIKDGRKVCSRGFVIIQTVRHYVLNGYVCCNESLNSKAWNTTEHLTDCEKCMEKIEAKHKQLTLF